MNTAVVVFPGSNCDRDAADALTAATGTKAVMVWHQETALPAGLDLVVLPGGFSYGDYLRCGAMAAVSPVMGAVKAFAARGGRVLGICNGFQILCESGLLPGVLLRNESLKFICKDVQLEGGAAFKGLNPVIPIAHAEGNYTADEATLDALEEKGNVAFRYRENPNGAARGIAGIFNEQRNVLGMMPHPERKAGVLNQLLDSWR